MPMYEVQLNAYATIGEQCGFKPVSDLALVYFEPITDTDAVVNKVNRRDNGFAMGFKSNIHKVKLNTEVIPGLLARVREIYDLDKPPERVEGCNDCSSVENLVRLLGR